MLEEEIDLTDDNALYKERKVEDGNISLKMCRSDIIRTVKKMSCRI